MGIDFYNNEVFGEKFLSISKNLLLKIENNNSEESLKKVKFNKLEKVSIDLALYKPEDKIRNEKKLFIRYLEIIATHSINSLSFRKLLELERDYILPAIDGKLRESGYTTKNGWLIATLMIMPLDIILIFLLGKYYFFIPFLSIFIMLSTLKDRYKAKKENKLW
mgnify:CR=1 FL=1